MTATRRYMSGFNNSHSTEAIAGVLPEGQNSPQRVARGLYAEKFSSTAFTAPRNKNARSWFYRIRPSVVQGAFEPAPLEHWNSGPSTGPAATPNQLRWDPLPVPDGLRSRGPENAGLRTTMSCQTNLTRTCKIHTFAPTTGDSGRMRNPHNPGHCTRWRHHVSNWGQARGTRAYNLTFPKSGD